MQQLRWVLPLCVLSACTITKEGDETRIDPAPIFADQSWSITQQDHFSGGSICTVSAGELDVTQYRENGQKTLEVALASKLNPGDTYKILMGNHVYETPSGSFNEKESQKIVRDLMASNVVYTEISKRMITSRGSQFMRAPNKLSLDGFSNLYKTCSRFTTR